jgi:hypothetical protein
MSKLIITIDTEHCTQAPGAIGEYPNGAWCTVAGRDYGFPLIMNICGRYGVSATFFVNVFEYRTVGEGRMVAMCEQILKGGHDIQLHTHPSFITGKAFMKESCLEEQTDLIGRGKEKLEAWTGRKVVAHRAGYYSVNEDTLVALSRTGIYLDSSVFYNHRYCSVNWAKFELTERFGMWELPVSWFHVRKADSGDGIAADEVRSVKFDIDKGPADVMIDFAEEARSSGYRYLTFAGHSFSFVREMNHGLVCAGDDEKAEQFDRLLGYAALSEGIQVQTR